MRRREMLAKTAGISSLMAFAGCSTKEGVHITQEMDKVQYKSVIVEVYLRNRGKPTAQAALHVSVEMDAGDTYEKTREVRVTPGAQGGASPRFQFDVGRNVNSGDYSVETWLTDVTYEGVTETSTTT